MIPEELKYTSDHEWVRLDGQTARIGITHYAQDSLGDIVFVQLPDVGDQLAAAQAFGEVESTKSVSDLYSPVAGQVVARNDALDANPELVNTDPYGEGWMIEIEVSGSADTDALLDAEAYKTVVAEG